MRGLGAALDMGSALTLYLLKREELGGATVHPVHSQLSKQTLGHQTLGRGSQAGPGQLQGNRAPP